MKKLLSLSFILATLSLNANELAWVDEQVDAIKPPRKGLSFNALAAVRDPFIQLDKSKSEKGITTASKTISSIIPLGITDSKTNAGIPQADERKRLAVDAIINKSALINGQWYKQNDVVQGYVIKSIHKTSIVLSKNEKDLVLSTNSKNLNLNFKNK